MWNHCQIDYNVCQLQRYDGGERLVLVHARGKKLVVDMPLVGVEDRGVVLQSDDDDAEHVECRHDEQAVGEGKTHFLVWHGGAEEHDAVFAVGDEVGAAHGKLYGEEAEHEAKGEAAGVAHEYLQSFLWLAEDVVVCVSQQNAHQSGYEDAVDVELYAVEPVDKSREGYERQSRCQSVDAVDEVHGVVDERYAEHRERRANPERYRPDAEKAVEIVDIQPRKRH